jgi:hypothetical protein
MEGSLQIMTNPDLGGPKTYGSGICPIYLFTRILVQQACILKESYDFANQHLGLQKVAVNLRVMFTKRGFVISKQSEVARFL